MTTADSSFVSELINICGDKHVLTEAGDCWAYGYDNSRIHRTPMAVALPADEAEVSKLISVCRQHKIPVTCRGRGTNTAGGSVPQEHGITISTEHLNRIIEYRPHDRYIRVQPGVTNGEVQTAVAKHGLFWAPDPTSAEVCSIGGNLAMNAAGPRAVKYGSTRNHVLGVRAVTGNGDILATGVVTSKGVVGYDLTRLLIGSEGTLAIITEATLQLLPCAESQTTIRLLYRDIDSATQAVSAVMCQPVIPSGLEFMDAASLAIVKEHANASFPADTQALLMIEVEGQADRIAEDAQQIIHAATNAGLIEHRQARNQDEAASLWSMRKALSPSLRKIAPNKINEDVVVPVSRIPELIDGLTRISERYAIPIVNFGHAGNGNIHVNLLFDSQDAAQLNNAAPCLDAVFDLVLKLDGTLSGEHGIGEVKRDYVGRELQDTALELMHAIKQQFDPAGILNPGKAF
ncbi:MAG: FAD-binding protein [Proteobacteria bacterium]|nr:FAD-binding protein [Pseudomonadota bacterium]